MCCKAFRHQGCDYETTQTTKGCLIFLIWIYGRGEMWLLNQRVLAKVLGNRVLLTHQTLHTLELH